MSERKDLCKTDATVVKRSPECYYCTSGAYSLKEITLSVLFFVEEKILFARIIRPNIFYRFVDFPFIFHFLQILDDFKKNTPQFLYHTLSGYMIGETGEGLHAGNI